MTVSRRRVTYGGPDGGPGQFPFPTGESRTGGQSAAQIEANAGTDARGTPSGTGRVIVVDHRVGAAQRWAQDRGGERCRGRPSSRARRA